MSLQDILRAHIKDVPNFPKQGITFKDITPLLSDSEAFSLLVDHIADRYREEKPTQIVGIESRGFILGAAIAKALGVGLTLVRKPGKLPRETREVTYDLEYGTDTLMIHADALDSEDRVLVIDDVLATGGTAAATLKLVESCGANVIAIAFLMELSFLEGRQKLGDHEIYSAVTY